MQRAKPDSSSSTATSSPEPTAVASDGASRRRRRYETPRIEKKRSLQRVTLFSGGGVSSTGLTASG